MTTIKSYAGEYFVFHMFKDDAKISIGLASNHVYVPTNKQELKNLIQFISENLDDNNSNTNYNTSL